MFSSIDIFEFWSTFINQFWRELNTRSINAQFALDWIYTSHRSLTASRKTIIKIISASHSCAVYTKIHSWYDNISTVNSRKKKLKSGLVNNKIEVKSSWMEGVFHWFEANSWHYITRSIGKNTNFKDIANNLFLTKQVLAEWRITALKLDSKCSQTPVCCAFSSTAQLFFLSLFKSYILPVRWILFPSKRFCVIVH